MIDLVVPTINNLENDSDVYSIVSSNIFRIIVPQQFADKYPYIRVAELNNIDEDYADDEAVTGNIHLQIDCWTKDDPVKLGNAVDKVMKSNSFKRYYVHNEHEEETSVFRKTLRYFTIKPY